MAAEVAWGRFEGIEDVCMRHRLACVRWAGAFAPERVARFAASDDDVVLISRDDARVLGSFAAIEAYFARADFAVPPFAVTGDDERGC